MANQEELIQTLARLDPETFEGVIASAYRQRLGAEADSQETRPGATATALQFAEWLARRHMSSDMALERVIYLPTGAPSDEIRLLEVNRLLSQTDSDAIEPLDFTPDNDPPFRVFVADITADQWERVKQLGRSVLPQGWDIQDNRIFIRG